MDKPKIEDRCSECGHNFSRHYTTYDDLKTGCSNVFVTLNEETHCSCKGYSVILKWNKPEQEFHKTYN